MLRAQRILITLGLLFLAWFLHVNLCEWVWKKPLEHTSEGGVFKYVQRPIVTWTQEPRRWDYSGLVTQAHVDLADAVVFGIASPLAMVMTVAYLWLGWRRDVRRARRLCVKCGYDLRGTPAPDAPCPECGAIQSRSVSR